jgi:hypothetical protein
MTTNTALKRRAAGAARPQPAPDADYVKELRAEVGRVLDLMEREWGFRPPVELHAAACLAVRADFGFKDFAHEGGRCYVLPDTTAGRNTPRKVALRLLGEVVSHRDHCRRCGTGLPTLFDRVSCLGVFLHPRYPGQLFHFAPPDAPVRKHRNARGEEQEYREIRRATRDDVERYFLVPADPVERYVFPGRARKLDRLIHEWNRKYHGPEASHVDRGLLPGAKPAVRCAYRGEKGCAGQKPPDGVYHDVLLGGFTLPGQDRPFAWSGIACRPCLDQCLIPLATEYEGRLQSRRVGDATTFRFVVGQPPMDDDVEGLEEANRFPGPPAYANARKGQ